MGNSLKCACHTLLLITDILRVLCADGVLLLQELTLIRRSLTGLRMLHAQLSCSRGRLTDDLQYQ
jgi:hypothetical protein